MRVLVACEFSGTVRDAFRRRGHDAWSCDLLPCEADPAFHIQGDVLDVLDRDWDLMIAHPPCTYLASSGLHWNNRIAGREIMTRHAISFVRKLLHAKIDKVAIENPVGKISTAIKRPTQIIQPWMFGHDASKATCLWLRNLPQLKWTNSVVRPAWVPCKMCDDLWCNRHSAHVFECDCPPLDEWVENGDDPYETRYANQTQSGQNKLGPSKNRWKMRSVTYQGLAEAMADQWGSNVRSSERDLPGQRVFWQ